MGTSKYQSPSYVSTKIDVLESMSRDCTDAWEFILQTQDTPEYYDYLWATGQVTWGGSYLVSDDETRNTWATFDFGTSKIEKVIVYDGGNLDTITSYGESSTDQMYYEFTSSKFIVQPKYAHSSLKDDCTYSFKFLIDPEVVWEPEVVTDDMQVAGLDLTHPNIADPNTDIDNPFLGSIGMSDYIEMTSPVQYFQGAQNNEKFYAYGYANDETNSATSKAFAEHSILWDTIPLIDFEMIIGDINDLEPVIGDVYA